MNKLRVRPIFKIHEVDFEVDIDKQVLREKLRPAYEISFVNDMTDHGDHYLLRLDPDEHTNIKAIQVPPMAELDPEGMSEKYNIPIGELKGRTDFEIIVDQQLLEIRHNGVLPQIAIGDDRFHVVLKDHELLPAGHWGPNISLVSFDLDDAMQQYEAFYHPVDKKVVAVNPKILELPDYVVKIKIPNEPGLDPVGAARIYGIDERELLRRYPIQKDLKAEIIPLSETYIPRLVQQNREKLKQEHEQNMQHVKPRIRPKF